MHVTNTAGLVWGQLEGQGKQNKVKWPDACEEAVLAPEADSISPTDHGLQLTHSRRGEGLESERERERGEKVREATCW